MNRLHFGHHRFGTTEQMVQVPVGRQVQHRRQHRRDEGQDNHDRPVKGYALLRLVQFCELLRQQHFRHRSQRRSAGGLHDEAFTPAQSRNHMHRAVNSEVGT